MELVINGHHLKVLSHRINISQGYNIHSNYIPDAILPAIMYSINEPKISPVQRITTSMSKMSDTIYELLDISKNINVIILNTNKSFPGYRCNFGSDIAKCLGESITVEYRKDHKDSWGRTLRIDRDPEEVATEYFSKIAARLKEPSIYGGTVLDSMLKFHALDLAEPDFDVSLFASKAILLDNITPAINYKALYEQEKAKNAELMEKINTIKTLL